jgi:hypothetical protein
VALPEEHLARSQGLVQVVRLTEGISGQQVVSVLQDAGDAAADRIAFNLSKGTVSGKVTAAQLKAVMEGVEPISHEMWGQIEKVTTVGMHSAGELAVNQSIDRDLLLGMPGNGIVQYAPGMFTDAAQSVESLISRRTNGFPLAERIYANGIVGVKQAARVVERELVLQRSRQEIVRQVKGLYNPNVPGGQSYAAKRLARTEINNAHHSTSIRLSKDRPWVLGMKWNLSSSHPRSDDCDDYAKQDHDGLGEGVYDKGKTPRKPHPQCLCYLTHLQVPEEDFINSLVSGQYDPWLTGKGVTC